MPGSVTLRSISGSSHRDGRKAHPAIEVNTAEELEQLGAHFESAGYEVDLSQRHNAEWFERFHTHDPFGNRIEVMHVLSST